VTVGTAMEGAGRTDGLPLIDQSGRLERWVLRELLATRMCRPPRAAGETRPGGRGASGLRSESMDMSKFFFPIVRVDRDGNATGLAGTAFPVTPGGGLVTCRHVVDIVGDDEQPIPISIMDGDRLVPTVTPVYLADPEWDIAFLPSALGRGYPHYFPILSVRHGLVGRDVYSVGYYTAAGQIQRGYFAGRVVSWRGSKTGSNLVDFASGDLLELVLPYAIIEGLSGAPVLIYENGAKVVGMCRGSESQRVLAQEVIETRDGSSHYRETLHRIVEFGIAYDSSVLGSFLTGVTGLEASASGYVETDQRLDIPGLED
jgi:Trypsin-like peptidase domain